MLTQYKSKLEEVIQELNYRYGPNMESKQFIYLSYCLENQRIRLKLIRKEQAIAIMIHIHLNLTNTNLNNSLIEVKIECRGLDLLG